MNLERGKSDFCLQYAGSPEEAIEHFHQAIDSQYRVQVLDGQRYQADIRRYGLFNYLFRYMYPQMVYYAEALSEYEARIHIDYEMSMHLRVVCHLGMVLSTVLMHLGANSRLLWWLAISLVFVGSVTFLYEVILHLMVDWSFSKKLAAICESYHLRPLWFEKPKKLIVAKDFVINAFICLASFGFEIRQGEFTPTNIGMIICLAILLPSLIWMVRMAYFAHSKSLYAKRYCSVVGIMVTSLVLILVVHCPGITGGTIVDNANSKSFAKMWESLAKEDTLEKQKRDEIIREFRRGAVLQCLAVAMCPSVVCLIGGAFVFAGYQLIGQYRDDHRSHHCQEMRWLLARWCQGRRSIDPHVLEGSVFDKAMILYTFLVFAVLTWSGMIVHVSFLLTVFNVTDTAIDANVHTLARIIAGISFILSENKTWLRELLRLALIAMISLPFIIYWVMGLWWLQASLRQWFRRRSYQSLLQDDRLPMDPKLRELLKQHDIEIVLDPNHDNISPYAQFELMSRRRKIILSEGTLAFFQKHPSSYIPAILAHEVGHCVKGHCFKIRVAELISRVGFISPGMLSLLFNPLKNEKEADDYATSILNELNLEPSLIKQAAFAMDAEEENRKPASKLRAAAFALPHKTESAMPSRQLHWFGLLRKIVHTFYTFQFDLTVYDYLHPPARYR